MKPLLVMEAWLAIGKRLVNLATSRVGALFSVLGFLVLFAPGYFRKPAILFLLAWIIGVFTYLAIFFNLNFVHDYYEIPFLAPLALLQAILLSTLFRILSLGNPLIARCLPTFLLTVLMLYNLIIAERHFYHIDQVRIEAARAIEQLTDENSLIIVAVGESAYSLDRLDCRDPRVLARAHRSGWAIDSLNLTVEIVERLRKEGATHVAIFGTDSSKERLLELNARYPTHQVELLQNVWKLWLIDLAGD